MKFMVLLLTIATLSCATWDKKSCDSLDWRKLGADDMATNQAHSQGLTAGYSYFGNCQKHGDVQRYKALYKQGVESQLRQICTLEGGREFGKAGYEARIDMCKPYDELAFLKGYSEGLIESRNNAAARAEKAESEAQCRWDTDCRKSNSCRFERCEIGGGKCKWQTDCKDVGRCSFGKCEYN